jgi:hypothetical protein
VQILDKIANSWVGSKSGSLVVAPQHPDYIAAPPLSPQLPPRPQQRARLRSREARRRLGIGLARIKSEFTLRRSEFQPDPAQCPVNSGAGVIGLSMTDFIVNSDEDRRDADPAEF